MKGDERKTMTNLVRPSFELPGGSLNEDGDDSDPMSDDDSDAGDDIDDDSGSTAPGKVAGVPLAAAAAWDDPDRAATLAPKHPLLQGPIGLRRHLELRYSDWLKD